MLFGGLSGPGGVCTTGLVGPGVFGDGVPGMDVCACPDTAKAMSQMAAVLARFMRLPSWWVARRECSIEPASCQLIQRVVPPGAAGARCGVAVPPVFLSLFHVQAGAAFRLSLVASTVTVVAPASVMAFGSYFTLSDL
jgi:hypothetical protein